MQTRSLKTGEMFMTTSVDLRFKDLSDDIENMQDNRLPFRKERADKGLMHFEWANSEELSN